MDALKKYATILEYLEITQDSSENLEKQLGKRKRRPKKSKGKLLFEKIEKLENSEKFKDKAITIIYLNLAAELLKAEFGNNFSPDDVSELADLLLRKDYQELSEENEKDREGSLAFFSQLVEACKLALKEALTEINQEEDSSPKIN